MRAFRLRRGMCGCRINMSDPIDRLNAAPSGLYRVERELGAGGTATTSAGLGQSLPPSTHNLVGAEISVAPTLVAAFRGWGDVSCHSPRSSGG